MIPTFIINVWLLALLSFGIIAGSAYLGHQWYHRSWGWDAVQQQSIFQPAFGNNEETWMFIGAIALALWALFGGVLTKMVSRLFCKPAAPGELDPHYSPKPDSTARVSRPDGSELNVEFYGNKEGMPLLVSHGWTLNQNEWNYLKQQMADKFRLIVWDEPGLGKSTRPSNGDFSLEKLAGDLHAVMSLTGNGPVVLLGHSIGGMIALTFCRLFPEVITQRVAGIVLTHTTPTNPVKTTSGAAVYTALQGPVLKPLMYLTIALSPLLWIASWLSYRNGTAHLSAAKSSFAGTQTWEQLDFAASFQPHSSPAVQARGMLGMMEYDALRVLPKIDVPVLIIAGDKDSTTKPEASRLMATEIPDASLHFLSPAKHLGLIEHYEDYAKLVTEFAHRVNAGWARTRGVSASTPATVVV